RVLDHPRHRVGPVEDGYLRPGGTLVEKSLDLPDDEPRLGVLVVQRAELDPAALTKLAPQPLGDPAPVVGDHGVRGGQDPLGRAIVLLELDHPGVGEVILEVEDVADLGAPEAVDRLRVIPHDREVAMARLTNSLPAQGLEAPAPDEEL